MFFFKIFFVLGIIFILIILWMFRNFQSVDMDLNKDCSISFFKIKNIEENVKLLPYHGKILELDKVMPSQISIDFYKGKGWGIKSNKHFKKGDIIYEYPITRMPVDYQIIAKCHLGQKPIIREVHLDFFAQIYNVFSSWSSFINHDDNPNCDYDTHYFVKNKKIFGTLLALKDIKKDSELTIDYGRINFYFLCLWDLIYPE